MVSKGRLATRSLARRPPRQSPRPRILVVCEGSSTEPRYLEDLIRDFRVLLIDIVIDARGGVPKTLVERAVEEKKHAEQAAKRAGDANLRYEEVWCVYDVDEHPKLLDARQQAEAHGIRLAISNPSFELWFLLHFQEQTAHIERDAARHGCAEHMDGYVKHATYRLLAPRFELAINRARALDQRHASNGEPGANPSTGAVHLALRLKSLGSGERLRQLTDR